jgi:crotonobetainyl-CoA:carnitine CoA-transferase CaiB-like acyl-CoA transferase
MDLTRGGGVPFKVGVSISDILGGQFALVAVLAGLAHRDRTGCGQYIDLSMQELSAWLTQFFWNGEDDAVENGGLLRCRNGYVYVAGPAVTAVLLDELRERHEHDTRADTVTALSAGGLRCAPVNTVSEVATHPQTAARELIIRRPSANGKIWPLLACPIRLSAFPVAVNRALGAVGEDLEEVLRDWSVNPVPQDPAEH